MIMAASVLTTESVRSLIKAHISYYTSQLRDFHAICLGPSSTADSTGLAGELC